MAEEETQQGSEAPTAPIPNSMTTELGKLIVDQHLATEEEVDKCMSIQMDQTHADSGLTFAELLVREGVVTANQVARVKRTLQASKSSQIPGYQILAKLGSGAMATVFKARQLSLDRIVAIKVLPRKLSENVEYVDRFYKEGKAAAKLNHPNIVQAIDVGESGGYHYFVMEYVEGKTLGDDLEAGKVFDEAEAMELIVQIGRALQHAHEHGFVHRDVKPKNIMVTPEKLAKLADMGLARAMSDVDAAQAEAGRAYGTPYYISPEQIRGEVDIDFRADIYALGATLYHLVTGRVPFEGPTPAAVMHKHLKQALTPPDHLNPSLSAGLGEVVEVMMAKDRKRRYLSTKDMLTDLESVSAGHPPLMARRQFDANLLSGLADVEAASPAAAEPEPEPEVEPPKSSNLLLLGLAVALAVSVLLNLLLVVLLVAGR